MYCYFVTSGGLYRAVENVVDSIELTRIVSPVVDSSCRKSICMYRYFMDLDFWWAIQGSRKI